MQWAIDTVGKLGPLVVAIAVYFSTRSQASFQRSFAIRTSRVEDQKLRLSLLERRMVALERIRSGIGDYWTSGAVTHDSVGEISTAAREAEFLFDKAEREAIRLLWTKAFDWFRYEARISGITEVSDERDRLIDLQDATATNLIEMFQPLLDQLSAAMRVESVEPFAEKPFWRKRVSDKRNS